MAGLLFFCAVISILVNYKSTGVFTLIDRKVPIYNVDTTEKKIALSFDASWGTDHTDQILDILDKYKVKASFFVVGAWVDQFPEKLKEVKRRGHDIGNHTNMHPDMKTISREKLIGEIAVCDGKIMAITGEGTNLFRCPSGDYNNSVIETVESTNHYCIQWDVDSIDWKEQGKQVEYNRVISGVRPGSIILFHNNAKYTPETLPAIIEKLQSEGYEFVKVSDMIYKNNYHIDSSGKQIAN